MASSSSALQRLSTLNNQLLPRSLNTTSGELVVKVSPEVSDALSSGRPVVALESTIISHGMPYPQNLETAQEVEAVVRKNGAVPATIAILDGVPCAGLNFEELEKLAILGRKVRKTSLRDIPYIVAAKGNGATTVSATMFFAAKVGISVFVTGGIGGVHRGNAMDVSTDLTALGMIPVAVFSAGVKSILDIPRTLEYLETMGVCVAAYGTEEFPAFFTETSGCKVTTNNLYQRIEKQYQPMIHKSGTFTVESFIEKRYLRSFLVRGNLFCFALDVINQAPCRVESPEECARLIDANFGLNLAKGLLFAVPIPSEHAASGNLIESAIQTALREAREKKITGSAETPYLLTRVSELTGGASLASNIALVKNNAAIASKAAVALARLRQTTGRRSGVEFGLVPRLGT